MFTTIKEFVDTYSSECDNTLKILGALTDSSLGQAVAPDHRTIGRLAWHITTSVPEMCGKAGLEQFSLGEDTPLPHLAAAMQRGYDAVSRELLEQIAARWTDDTLREVRNFYGFDWSLGFAMGVFLRHEIHHRGQMTVLMRQAGLKVPGVYGPSLEEWANYGSPPPKV